MKNKKKILYKARWGQAGQPATASVDFYAKDDEAAKTEANRIARELGVTNTPRTIMQGLGGGMVECITTGVSS